MAKAPPLDADTAYNTAIRMLARKARSCAEVRIALTDKGASGDDVESVIGRLKSHRHLDDAELASDQAYSLIDSKGLSPERAVYMLTERGIASTVARQAVDAIREGQSDWVLCERALARRLRGKALSEKNAGREARALARLGYEGEIVTRAIDRALRRSDR